MEGNIVIYKTEDNSIKIKLNLEENTIWLTQSQIAELFERDVNTIIEHTQNIYKENELPIEATSRKSRVVQIEGDRKVTRSISHYNLDMIISIGYRVSSKRATQFRIWATDTLRKHLVDGYTINEDRLKSNSDKFENLNQHLRILRKVIENEEFTLEQSKDLVRVVSDYGKGLELIDQVDHERVEIPKDLSNKQAVQIDYQVAVDEIDTLRDELNAHSLFGNEKDDGFKSALLSVHQSIGGNNVYPSLEEKAANLLYLIIKNHPFTDGNKRIGAFMFIRFLDINGLLYLSDGTRLVEQNALVAIALLIAQSDPSQKQLMVNLVVNLISGRLRGD